MMTENETQRLTAQSLFDSERSQEERNKLGQFATPTRIANEIVIETLAYCSFNEIRFLDPGIGTGSFYSALLNNLGDKKIISAHGYDIDPRLVKFSNELWGAHGLKVSKEDFTSVKNPRKVNLLIANPPYVRHHHLGTEDKVRLKAEVLNSLGIDISGLAGLYCYFMLLSDKALEDGAVSAWLVPSEFLDVNYGSAVKRYLLNNVDLLRIHKFDPNDTQFADALVSSTIVWFKKSSPSNNPVLFTHGDLKTPKSKIKVSREKLNPLNKWSAHFKENTVDYGFENSILFSTLFKVKRGIATGANDFFVLDESKIKELKIPKRFLSPILPSPRDVKEMEIIGDEKGIPENIERLYLFSSTLAMDELKSEFPNVASYISAGIKAGVHETYLCSKRKPWYNQEKREPPLFFCTYMGRSDGASGSPFRFILNRSNAIATNVYLLLYPTEALKELIAEDSRLVFRLAKFLNEIEPSRLISGGRVYGGGLHKMEPKELGNLPIQKHELGL